MQCSEIDLTTKDQCFFLTCMYVFRIFYFKDFFYSSQQDIQVHNFIRAGKSKFVLLI